MSVTRRPDSPHWVIEFEYRGKRYKRSSGTAKKALAVKIEAQWREELEAQVLDGKPVSMSLGEAAGRYHRTVLRPRYGDRRTTTAAEARYRIERIVASLGHTDERPVMLESITSRTLSDWIDARIKAGKKPGTVNRDLRTIKAILNRAKEWGALKSVPSIAPLEANDSRERYMTEEECGRLLAAIEDRDVRDLVVFLIDTGARRGEALQLRWADFDLDNRVVVFRRETTKTGAARAAPLTARVMDVLRKRVKHQTPWPFDPVTLLKPGVRSGKGGRRKKTAAKGLVQSWRDALVRAKLIGLRMHDLRHTFASRVVTTGQSLYTTGELLGHRDPKTTKRYAHLAPRHLRAAIDAIEPKPEASNAPSSPPSAASPGAAPREAGQASADGTSAPEPIAPGQPDQRESSSPT
jgi:integrase